MTMSRHDMMLITAYDDYIDRTECKPEVIDTDYEYEGPNEPPSVWHTYNCEGCDETDCPHWSDYND